jgi:predicted transcriptional regulator
MKRTMTNYEEVYYKFIPAFRARAAVVMVNELGMTQEEAAALLNTTQAAVNGYLNKRQKNSSINISGANIKQFVSCVAEGDNVSAKKILCKSCQEFKSFDCEIMLK